MVAFINFSYIMHLLLLRDMQTILAFLFLGFLVLWPISIIKPNLFAKYIRGASRRKNSVVFGLLTVSSFVLFGITTPPLIQKINVKGSETSNIPTSIQSPTLAPILSPTAITSPAPISKISTTITPTKKIFIPTATPTPRPYVPPTSAPAQYVPPTSPPSTVGGWACNCSKTCPQISSCAEAQYLLNSCGCSARDGDHDGIACDGAPLHCQN